jgi:hypothetical protein
MMMMVTDPGSTTTSAVPAASKRDRKWKKGKKTPIAEVARESAATQLLAREGVPMLQLGRPLSVCDHAFQRLCGLMLDTCPGVKAEALKGLAGEVLGLRVMEDEGL